MNKKESVDAKTAAVANINSNADNDEQFRCIYRAGIIGIIVAAITTVGMGFSIGSDIKLLKWYSNKKKGNRK